MREIFLNALIIFRGKSKILDVKSYCLILTDITENDEFTFFYKIKYLLTLGGIIGRAMKCFGWQR